MVYDSLGLVTVKGSTINFPLPQLAFYVPRKPYTYSPGETMDKSNYTGNTKIKEEHKIKTINCIRKYGPVSRTDIGMKTNISKPTITRIVDDFIKDGLVKETGTLEASSKRKPVGIELNPEAYYCIGINISKNTLRAIIADFAMNVILKNQTDIKKINDADMLLHAIHTSICNLIEGNRIDTKRILGIGIGITGIVDHNNGVVVDFASSHQLVDIPLKEYLESKLGFRVFVDNDANAQALGEYWYGHAVGYENSISVNCREGIGSGIISGGRILRGKNNVTGEFGHMIINMFGRQCNCGRYGCIEAYCSTEAIENIAKVYLRRGRQSLLSDLVKGDVDRINYEAIVRCAGKGDKLCLECLQEAANILSMGLVNLIDILNPEIVILSGDLFENDETFFEMLKEYTREKLFNSFSQDVLFVKREINDNLYEIGAAALVYKDFFRD